MMMDFRQMAQKHNLNITGVLHVGSNDCAEAELYSHIPSVKPIPVYWIEAIPSMHEKAREVLAKYPNQYALNACVSNTDGEEVEFKISNNGAQSSSFLELGHHSIIHPSVHYIERFKTKTTRLDTLFRLLDVDISALNFGNFDIQGTELLALMGMGDLLKQFDYLWIEVNKKETYAGCALVDDIDNFLFEFERVETGDWVADTWTDALYIRKTLL